MKKYLLLLCIIATTAYVNAQINPLSLSKHDYHPQVSQLKYLGTTNRFAAAGRLKLIRPQV